MMEELLHILEKNARLPVEDIAAMMGKTHAQLLHKCKYYI